MAKKMRGLQSDVYYAAGYRDDMELVGREGDSESGGVSCRSGHAVRPTPATHRWRWTQTPVGAYAASHAAA